ncbi:MAG: amidase [Rhodovibrionaceae bacterium]
MDDACFLGVAELRARFRSGALDPAAFVRFVAERAEAENTQSHAFTGFCPERAERVLLETPRAAPLYGIPYSCKDLIGTRDLPTTAASPAWADYQTGADAEIVAQLEALGAVLIGKNNLHEWALGTTGVNAHYGTAVNPYDPTRLAGGSSTGSAIAVARGYASFALGTDTGGSVRAPAALCGLVGFKPSHGRLSTEGVLPFSWSFDHIGLFARSVADTALIFSLLAPGPELRQDKPLKIGLPRAFYFEHCDPEILAAVEAAAGALQERGAELRDVAFTEPLELSRSASITVQMAEAASFHRPHLEARAARYSEEFRAGLALGQSLLATHYIDAKRMVEAYRRDAARILEEVDFLLTPACPIFAPPLGTEQVTETGIVEGAGNALTRYTSLFNMTGQPAIVLPLGLGRGGLPMGLQLVGRGGGDEALLAAALRMEDSGIVQRPPPPDPL